MLKVALIEDDTTMRKLLKTLLEIEGFQPVAFKENPDSNVLEFLKQEEPRAILLDVNLNFNNGFEIIEKIRLDPMLSSTKVLMSSGLDYREKSLKAGADEFLQKPYMPDKLIHWLKSL